LSGANDGDIPNHRVRKSVRAGGGDSRARVNEE